MLNPHGTGQVLVYPYCTVNSGKDTLLTLTNTSHLAKVVKVAFRESYNGRSVLEFLLYLSVHDSWTGAIGASAGDGATLHSRDHSCMTPSRAPTMPCSQPATPVRTTSVARERASSKWSIGSITPGSATEEAITHIQSSADPANPNDPLPNGGMPGGCTGLDRNAMLADLVKPDPSLIGSAAMVTFSDVFAASSPTAHGVSEAVTVP